MPQGSQSTVAVPAISARQLLLLLIYLGDETSMGGLGGITRIQKLLFLLESEEHIRPNGEGFKFEPYKAGPYSPRIYDDLEFLENLDFLRRSPARAGTQSGIEASQSEKAEVDLTLADTKSAIEASEPEKAEVDLTFEELMGPEDVLTSKNEEISPTADSYEEAKFYLTEKGKAAIEQLLANNDYKPFVEGIRKVKSRFAKYSLSDLLYYVYTKYPRMTTESEIKEKVLRRRPA
jgi:uncharacterized protein YwgA